MTPVEVQMPMCPMNGKSHLERNKHAGLLTRHESSDFMMHNHFSKKAQGGQKRPMWDTQVIKYKSTPWRKSTTHWQLSHQLVRVVTSYQDLLYPMELIHTSPSLKQEARFSRRADSDDLRKVWFFPFFVLVFFKSCGYFCSAATIVLRKLKHSYSSKGLESNMISKMNTV